MNESSASMADVETVPPLELTAGAYDELRVIATQVNRIHGSKEVAVLLLGPNDQRRRCTKVFLLRNQRVTSASFDCDATSLQQTVTEALDSTGLELLGIAHLHPPMAMLGHSSRDNAWISERLAPHLAALPRFRRCWSRPATVAREDGASVISLDHAGRIQVRCAATVGEATIAVTETFDQVYSVVFQVAEGELRFYVCELSFSYSPVPDEEGGIRLTSTVAVSEPELVVVDEPYEPIDEELIGEEVRQWVRPSWGWGGDWDEDDEDRWSTLAEPRRALVAVNSSSGPCGASTTTLTRRAAHDVDRALRNDEPTAVTERLVSVAKLLAEVEDLVREGSDCTTH